MTIGTSASSAATKTRSMDPYAAGTSVILFITLAHGCGPSVEPPGPTSVQTNRDRSIQLAIIAERDDGQNQELFRFPEDDIPDVVPLGDSGWICTVGASPPRLSVGCFHENGGFEPDGVQVHWSGGCSESSLSIGPNQSTGVRYRMYWSCGPD